METSRHQHSGAGSEPPFEISEERKVKGPLKFWIMLGVAITAAVSVVVRTEMRLEGLVMRADKAERELDYQRIEQRQQRDMLIEIKGDVKAVLSRVDEMKSENRRRPLN